MTLLSGRSLKVHFYTIMTSYNNYLKPKVQKDKARKIQMSMKEKRVHAVHTLSRFSVWHRYFISWLSPRTMCPNVKNVFTLLHFRPTGASKRAADKPNYGPVKMFRLNCDRGGRLQRLGVYTLISSYPPSAQEPLWTGTITVHADSANGYFKVFGPRVAAAK